MDPTRECRCDTALATRANPSASANASRPAQATVCFPEPAGTAIEEACETLGVARSRLKRPPFKRDRGRHSQVPSQAPQGRREEQGRQRERACKRQRSHQWHIGPCGRAGALLWRTGRIETGGTFEGRLWTEVADAAQRAISAADRPATEGGAQ